jgi:hypothetical protein
MPQGIDHDDASATPVTHYDLIFASLMGAAIAVFILGITRINPANTAWLTGDFAQIQIGWEMFRQEPHWLGLMTARGSHPVPLGLALSDAAPLLALLLRAGAGALPEKFQYIGLYLAACLTLQALFGALCTAELWTLARGSDSRFRRLSILLGALLFALMPATMLRMGGHMALSSHYLIVASLWLTLRSIRTRAAGRLWPSAALVLFATGINPYIAFLCALSPVAYLAVSQARSRTPIRQAIIAMTAMAAPLAVIFLVGSWLFGFIGGAVPDLNGYRLYSMNMLGPFDTAGYGGWLPRLSHGMGGQQYEGYNYLGLGIFALLTVTLATRLARPTLSSWRTAHPVFLCGLLVAIATYGLALSTRVTFADATLFEVPVPGLILKGLALFRASGRLFWAGGFWLLTIGLFGALLIARGSRAVAVLAAATLLQIADLASVAKGQSLHHASTRNNVLPPLPVPPQVMARTKYLHIVPAWQCEPDKTPGGAPSFESFGLLATQHKWLMNSFYAGRLPRSQFDYHCAVPRFAPDDPALAAATLYAVSSSYYLRFLAAHNTQVACSKLRDFALCWSAPQLSETPDLDFGRLRDSVLDFTDRGNVTANLSELRDGWHAAESWGRWTNGPVSQIHLRMAHTTTAPRLLVTARGFQPSSTAPQTVRVSVNGQQVAMWSLTDGEGNYTAVMPGTYQWGQFVTITFASAAPTSPLARKLSDDPRLLALGVQSFRIEPQ